MPPLTLHTVIAKGVAERLRRRVLDEERGNLYLGSTAPDIRVITRWERERTHFFDLAEFDEQSSVVGFFQANPHLAVAAKLQSPTVAFTAGYLTHLVMDETWINTMYRPFFGERSPLGGDVRANIMDRALQFSLDRDRRADTVLMAHVLDAVARCDLQLDIDFIDDDTLRRWRDVVMDVVQHPPDWERFRYIASRHLKAAGVDSPETFREFVRELPDMVEETVRYLTPERVKAYLEESMTQSLEAVKEYLECG
jgi:hypothetical protein